MTTDARCPLEIDAVWQFYYFDGTGDWYDEPAMDVYCGDDPATTPPPQPSECCTHIAFVSPGGEINNSGNQAILGSYTFQRNDQVTGRAIYKQDKASGPEYMYYMESFGVTKLSLLKGRFRRFIVLSTWFFRSGTSVTSRWEVRSTRGPSRARGARTPSTPCGSFTTLMGLVICILIPRWTCTVPKVD